METCGMCIHMYLYGMNTYGYIRAIYMYFHLYSYAGYVSICIGWRILRRRGAWPTTSGLYIHIYLYLPQNIHEHPYVSIRTLIYSWTSLALSLSHTHTHTHSLSLSLSLALSVYPSPHTHWKHKMDLLKRSRKNIRLTTGGLYIYMYLLAGYISTCVYTYLKIYLCIYTYLNIYMYWVRIYMYLYGSQHVSQDTHINT